MKKLYLLISFIGLVQLASAQCSVTATELSAVVCNGQSNGVAYAANGGGGTPPYTYLWTPSSQTMSTATGLAAGVYTVTLHDAVGCSATDTVLIHQPPVINPNPFVVHTASCVNGNDACVQATPSGGNGAPYYYAWSSSGPYSSTQYTMCGIEDGGYTVTVTDYKGCTAVDTVFVPQPPNPLTATQSNLTNATCNGSCNGSVTFTFTGGNPPYFFHSTQLPGNTVTLNNQCAGSGQDDVYDNAGCQFHIVWSIGQPPVLGGQAWNLQDASGCSTPNGVVYADPAGGSPGYTYSWTPTGGTGKTASGLAAGDYYCIVTDSHGCTATLGPAQVTQPGTLSAFSNVTSNPTCPGGNQGCANVSVSGGTSPYTYSWAPSGGTNATACGLDAGNYFCYVTDHLGCQIQVSAQIIDPTPVTVSATVTSNVSCFGLADGCGTVTASGGTPGYSYDWNTPWNPNCQLPAGTYTVTATDSHGCSGTDIVIVTQPAALTVSASPTNATCGGCPNGSVSSTVTGGTHPYTFWWSTSPTQTTQAATGLLPGTYTVCVTDSNGCQTCTSATVSFTISVGDITNPTTFLKVYPNPFHTSATLVINSDNGLIEVSIYDLVGKEVQRMKINNETSEIRNLTPGVYILKAQTVDGKTALTRLIVQ